MFLNIQIDLIVLQTYDRQFTLTTKKSLHIIFNTVHQKVCLCSLFVVWEIALLLFTRRQDCNANKFIVEPDF